LPDLLINNGGVEGFWLMFYAYAGLGLGCAALYARVGSTAFWCSSSVFVLPFGKYE
jgi:hypothetical protein